MAVYRVLLADDHTHVRAALKMVLAQRPEFAVVGEAGDGLELLKLMSQKPAADVVIVDITMPRLSGISAIREIVKMNLNIKVLILTMHKDKGLLCQSFVAGADGYLLKEDLGKELFRALNTVLAAKIYVPPCFAKELNDTWLTVFMAAKRSPSADALTLEETEVLKLLAEGESSTVIAKRLSITTGSVGHHQTQIVQKLKLKAPQPAGNPS